MLFMKRNILILLGLLVSFWATAQINYQPQTIKVTGTAEKLVEPNEVHLVVHLKQVKERNKEMSLTEARTELMKVCTAVGIVNENIKLSNANSRLEKKLRLWRKTKTTVVQRETYDIRFTDMNKLLSCIEKLDEPYVETLNFGEQTHTEIARFRREVKEDATKAAIEKAKYLAVASGQEVGRVVFIEELRDVNTPNVANHYSNNIAYKKGSYGGGAKVNFGFKQLALHYKVLVICELK